jgi:hypothetical protein
MSIFYIINNSELALTGQTIFGDLNITGGTITIDGVSLIEEINKAYINYFDFSSSTVTNITTADTWVKLSADTTSLFSSGGELIHTNNRITYTGTTPTVFQIEGIISVSAGNNQELSAAFFKNGVLYPCSEQSGITGFGVKTNSIPFHCVIELQQNDYVEVYVKNKSGTTDITLDNINVIITEL